MMSLFSVVPPLCVEDRLNLSDALKLNLGVLGERQHLFMKGLNESVHSFIFSFQPLKFGVGGWAIVEVDEHANASSHDLLERIGGLDRLTSELGLLGHDQRLEWRPRFQGVHLPQNPGRLLNSAPLMPSSTWTCSSATAHP